MQEIFNNLKKKLFQRKNFPDFVGESCLRSLNGLMPICIWPLIQSHKVQFMILDFISEKAVPLLLNELNLLAPLMWVGMAVDVRPSFIDAKKFSAERDEAQ